MNVKHFQHELYSIKATSKTLFSGFDPQRISIEPVWGGILD